MALFPIGCSFLDWGHCILTGILSLAHEEDDLLSLMMAGGLIMPFVVVGSIMALTIVIQTPPALKQARIVSPQLLACDLYPCHFKKLRQSAPSNAAKVFGVNQITIAIQEPER